MARLPARKRMINGDDMDKPRTRFCLMAAIVTAALSGAAIAQAPATRAAPAASTGSSKASLPSKVESWTKAHWEAAKKEWAKDTTKWANCQKQWNRHKHE